MLIQDERFQERYQCRFPVEVGPEPLVQGWQNATDPQIRVGMHSNIAGKFAPSVAPLCIKDSKQSNRSCGNLPRSAVNTNQRPLALIACHINVSASVAAHLFVGNITHT